MRIPKLSLGFFSNYLSQSPLKISPPKTQDRSHAESCYLCRTIKKYSAWQASEPTGHTLCITKCNIFTPCHRINGNMLILIAILLSNYEKKKKRLLQTLGSNCRNTSVAHITTLLILNYCSIRWVIQIQHCNMHVSNSVLGIPHSSLFW